MILIHETRKATVGTILKQLNTLATKGHTATQIIAMLLNFYYLVPISFLVLWLFLNIIIVLITSDAPINRPNSYQKSAYRPHLYNIGS